MYIHVRFHQGTIKTDSYQAKHLLSATRTKAPLNDDPVEISFTPTHARSIEAEKRGRCVRRIREGALIPTTCRPPCIVGLLKILISLYKTHRHHPRDMCVHSSLRHSPFLFLLLYPHNFNCKTGMKIRLLFLAIST